MSEHSMVVFVEWLTPYPLLIVEMLKQMNRAISSCHLATLYSRLVNVINRGWYVGQHS